MHSRSSGTFTRVARLWVIIAAFGLLRGSEAAASGVIGCYIVSSELSAGAVEKFDTVSAEFVAENLTSDPR